MSLPASLPPSEGPFDTFTETARHAILLADDAARTRHHDHLGTEHLLLGLLAEEDSPASAVLQRLRVSPDEVRQRVAAIIGTGDGPPVTGDICLTPRVKKVFELAADEARRMHQRQVFAMHLLLGIARERNGIGGRVLRDMHVELGSLRRAVAEIQHRPSQEAPDRERATGGPSGAAAVPEFAPAAGPKTNVVTCRLDDATLEALDTLVAAGIRPTRSDAAAWLIRIGLEANRPLLQRVSTTVAEIRRLRREAQSLAHETGEGSSW
jgi:ATP-dependent Clp protease ATP-binding subunit ClpA